jgi:hypothetical protein
MAAESDIALGVGPFVQFFYSLTPMNHTQYLAYLANPTGDPTPTTGTLFQGLNTLGIPDNGIGMLVRVVATLPGRATSKCANAFYFPAYPASTSSSGWQI